MREYVFLQTFQEEFYNEFFFEISPGILLETCQEFLLGISLGFPPKMSLKDAIVEAFFSQRFKDSFTDFSRNSSSFSLEIHKIFAEIQKEVSPRVSLAVPSRFPYDLFISFFRDSFRSLSGDAPGIYAQILSAILAEITIESIPSYFLRNLPMNFIPSKNDCFLEIASVVL